MNRLGGHRLWSWSAKTITFALAVAIGLPAASYSLALAGTPRSMANAMRGSAAILPASSPNAAWLVSPTRTMVLDVGPYGSADGVYARAPFVLRDSNGSYKMWYSGNDGYQNRMLFATSPDGIHWTKEGVVFDVNTPPYYWDSVGGQCVLKIGSVYQMWFSAGYWNGGVFGYWAQIYHATSMDAVRWNVTGVALAPGQGWDAGMVNGPQVVRDAQGVFWLIFFGWDGTANRIGVATSANGTSFVPYAGNPILNLGPADSWDSEWLQDTSVVLDGSSWTLWYDAWNGTALQIGIANSNDGYNWTKAGFNPILRPESPPAWDAVSVGYPAFLSSGFGPRLYFAGSSGGYIRIGLVNLSVPGSGTPDSVLGLPTLFLVALIGFAAVAAALFVLLGTALRKEFRRGPR